MRRVSVVAGVLFMFTGLFAQEQPKDSRTATSSQSSVTSPSEPQRCGLKRLDLCLKDVAHDQAGIWTSPLRVKPHDAIWLVPFAAATGAAFAFDQDALRQVDPTNKSLIDKSGIISRFGSAYATFGEAGVMYLIGAATHNDHLRETGVLGAEAVVNATLVTGGLKLATNRERPDEGSGAGGFWPHGPSDYSPGVSFASRFRHKRIKAAATISAFVRPPLSFSSICASGQRVASVRAVPWGLPLDLGWASPSASVWRALYEDQRQRWRKGIT